jgi:hypothetical protein
MREVENSKIIKTKSLYVLTKIRTFTLKTFYVKQHIFFCPLYHFGYSVIKSRELYFHHFPTCNNSETTDIRVIAAGIVKKLPVGIIANNITFLWHIQFLKYQTISCIQEIPRKDRTVGVEIVYTRNTIPPCLEVLYFLAMKHSWSVLAFSRPREFPWPLNQVRWQLPWTKENGQRISAQWNMTQIHSI